MASNGNNYLLVIALNRFKSCKPLFYSVQGAQTLIRVLQGSFGFHEEHTLRLFNERASHIAIWKALDTLGQKLNPNDTLCIYYAGYSFIRGKTFESCLLGYDSNLEGPFGLVYHQALVDRINKLPAKDILLLVNSGFSANLIQETPSIIHTEWEEPGQSFVEKAHSPLLRTRWGIASMPLGYDRDKLIGDSPAFIKSICGYLQAHAGEEIAATELFEHVREIPTYDSSKPIGGYLGDSVASEGVYVFTPQSQTTPVSQPISSPTRAPESEEERDWREAIKINSVPAYMDFIWKYPDSPRNEVAQRNIRRLQSNSGSFLGGDRKFFQRKPTLVGTCLSHFSWGSSWVVLFR